MPKYHVHLYPVVRVWIPDIEADSMEQAIDKAAEKEDFSCFRDVDDNIEYAEEISHYLVDVAGDKNYEQSRWFGPNKEPDLPNPGELLFKILNHKEVLPVLLGIDDKLDDLIAQKMKEE